MNKGVFYAASAYIIWGFFPIYFKLLHSVPAIQIVAHRVVWSFVFLMAVIFLGRQFASFGTKLKLRNILLYTLAGILLGTNWLTYVWGVNAGYVVEASLGYFINPLVSILLGMVFLKEKLRPLQWLPVTLAAIGVTYLTLSYGALPWIALVLAFSFGLYGLVKKVAPLNSLHGLTLETGALFIPALGFLLFSEANGTGAFIHLGWSTTILLALAGVITSIPLLLFAAGARRVSLTTIGLLQYFSPTLQFLIGVLVYHEDFTQGRVIGFTIIWIALVIFSMESYITRRRAALAAI